MSASMSTRIGALVALAFSPTIGRAAPVVVWLSSDAPSERARAKAERETGPALHTYGFDLAFPPTALGPQKAASQAALRTALDDAAERWAEFDVEGVLATELHTLVDQVPLVEDAEDAALLRQALLLEGAAAYRAFSPENFGDDSFDGAGSLRVGVSDALVPAAWRDAVAIGGMPRRAELVDGTAWVDFGRFDDALQGQRAATLDWSNQGLPAGATVVVDGTVQDSTSASLTPGRHWVHVVVDGVPQGPRSWVLSPGEESTLIPAVTEEMVQATAARVLASGSSRGSAQAMQDAIADIAAVHGDEIFLAAQDGGRLVMVPYGAGARLNDSTLVTGVLTGAVGGGILQSALFDQATGGDALLAPSASAGLSAELGISHFAMGLGLDASLTPGRTISTVNGAGDGNLALSIQAQPWVGLGAYVLRPTGRKPTLVAMGHVAYIAPAHLGYGGRLAVGVPIDDKRTWLRIEGGASYAPQTLWNLADDPLSLVTGFLRVGFAAGL